MAGKQRNALPIGDQIQNYRIEDVLGSGGFGITYVASEAVTDRKVAIKEFLPSNIAVRDRDSRSVHPISETDREDFDWGLERFRQEAKVLITLEHRNIVPVLNYFEANGTGYLVMAYQDGKSLGALLKRDMKLSQAEIDEILLPIVDGIGAIHAAGFLHRDIKPDNIFVRSDGVPVIIDFGSARLALGQHTKSLTAIVSEGYAPFEQYQSDGNQGPWTDIYAIGATLYRCVTGHRPIEAPARVAAVVKGKPDPMEPAAAKAGPGYSATLLGAIDKALTVDEGSRPQDIAAFSALLRGEGTILAAPAPAGSTTVLVGGTAPTGADPAAPAATAPAGEPDRTLAPDSAPATQPAPRRAGRKRTAIAAAALGVLIAGGASAYVAVERPWEPSAQELALLERQKQEAEEKRKAEEARLKAEVEAKRKAEEARRQAEVEARRKAEEERLKAEAEAKRKAEDARRKAEAEARQKAEEERLKAQAEAKRKAEEEARRKAEAEARRKAEKERLEAEAEARRKAAEEARRKAEAEAAKQRAEAEARRKAAEEARRRAQEDPRRKAAEEARRKALEARRRQLAEARRKALAERRQKALEAQRKRQLAARTPAAAQYVPGRRLTYRIESGRGMEHYVLSVSFKAGGALYMSCSYTNSRDIPETCREYTGGPGRWSVNGNTLCLAFRYGRDCFTLVKRGAGYALAPHRRSVRVRYFR